MISWLLTVLAVAGCELLVYGLALLAWTHHKRDACPHHDIYAEGGWTGNGKSWVGAALIEAGSRKMWACSKCGRRWFSS